MFTRFVKTSSTDMVTEMVTSAITEALEAGKRVVWLVSGGSLIAVEAAIMKQLAQGDCTNLAIFQADERYGDVGHADSNWQKLCDAGFEAGSAYAVPVLADVSFDETVRRYDGLLKAAFNADNVCVVGLFGIGKDGHTAGILPDSPATGPGVAFVSGYEGPDFKRITMTPVAIARVDAAFAYAAGDDKVTALKQLYETEVSPAKQPAQWLKTAKRTIILNDQLEGDV